MIRHHPLLCLWLAVGLGMLLAALGLLWAFSKGLKIVAEDDTLEDPDIEMGAVYVPRTHAPPQVVDAPELSGSAGAS